MRNGLKLILAAGFGLAMLQGVSGAEDKPAAEKPMGEFKDAKEKLSYSIGVNIGNNLKRNGFEVDTEVLSGALKDAFAGKETKMTDPQAMEVIRAHQTELRNKQMEERKKVGEKNKQEGAAFLAENKKKDGIKVHEVKMPDGTTAEMQYKVITDGTGPIPKSTDTVTVNYRGTLINGTEFDSSAKHGQPLKFQVNRVVRGWTEALQLMKVGSKWQLFLSSTLAYGDSGSGPTIEPGATLIFDIELVSTEAPAPPPTPQPLTSDIIRVPSAEEIKKGAKIEVIKPEDAERMARGATNNPPKQ
jgi:FKBP-type peptidyl-prolyl cis-trans isomerase FklB